MTGDGREIQNDVCMININDNLETRIKKDLISLANSLNIIFIDEDTLKFKLSQEAEIKKLIEKFIVNNNIKNDTFELVQIG